MMPQPDPVPTPQREEISLEAAEAQYQLIGQAFRQLLERITPWLFDVGSWIFGGLIALTVVVLASLITIGPVDLSVKLAAAALAVALPLNVTGLVLLKLVQDLQPVGFEKVTQAFQEVGLTPGEQQIPSLSTLEAMRTRGTRIVLSTTLGILGLSGVLTLSGLTAALWHLAWWIGVAFLAVVLISLLIIQIALVTSQPPVSAEERAHRKRNRDELIRQARERSRQAKARK